MCLRLILTALCCAVAFTSFPADVSAECPVPPGFANQTTLTENGVKYTFALDQFTYTFHADTIRFHYAVENVGTESVSFPCTCADLNAFVIYPSECLSLDQPGCFENAIFFLPQLCFLFCIPLSLDPGECEEFSMSWRQTPNTFVDHTPGTYRAFAGLWILGDEGDGWPGQFIGSSGLSLDLEIVETPNPAHTTTWGQIKALYR